MFDDLDGPPGHMFNFPDLVAARAAARKARRGPKAAPSPNGDNGPPAPPEPEPPPKQPRPGRTADGKFAPGNSGGPGNPFARRVASFREALYEAVTREMLKDLASRLWGMAIGGNVAAARLLLQYLVGKPQDPPNPDRLEHDEWQTYQSEAVAPADMTRLLGAMPAAMANHWADGVWPVLADCNIRRPMLEGVRAVRLQQEAQAAGNEGKQAPQTAPSPNGHNGQPTAPEQPPAHAAPEAPATPPQHQPAPGVVTPAAGRQQTVPPAATGQRSRPAPRVQPPAHGGPAAVSKLTSGPVPRGRTSGTPSPNGGHGAAAGAPGRRPERRGKPADPPGGAGTPSPNGDDGWQGAAACQD